MKSSYSLAALALAFTTASSAPTAQGNDRIFVIFCKTKTGSVSDCTQPVSIYQEQAFTIPAGYNYARSITVPVEDVFTLIKSQNGQVVSCDNLLTGVKWEDIAPGTQSTGSTVSYNVFPGRSQTACTGSKCVKCANYGI